MQISCQFDGGRIEPVATSDQGNIRVRIAADSAAEFRQWFYFRMDGLTLTPAVLTIENAGESSYPKWEGYRLVASYDRENWFRLDTEWDGMRLTVRFTPEAGTMYVAYFAPYSHERHLDLLAHAVSQRVIPCELLSLGKTVQGRSMDALQIGTPGEGKRVVWVIARQHPGETMAEWCAEGFVHRLLNSHDALANRLLERAVIYVVPNMNPDGAFLGNLRTNAAGANLNREWLTPTVETSPEVYYVRQKMHDTGVDCFLDLHGDEQLPYVFLAGCEGIPTYSDQQKQWAARFKAKLQEVNPDFQTEHGYEVDGPGEATLMLATDYVAHAFGCLAYTLEMPFKDNANRPDAEEGWSPARSMLLGASLLHAIVDVLD
jgi:murein tripeptide amidase MpaA